MKTKEIYKTVEKTLHPISVWLKAGVDTATKDK